MMRLGTGVVFAAVLAIAQLPASIAIFTVLCVQGTVAAQAADSLEDSKAAFSDWSRGTTILIDGMRTFLQSYRQKLAERLNVPVSELTGIMANQSSLALQAHRFVVDDYEAYAEKEALAAGVDPRTVNPKIRAKFGELMVASPDKSAERLADALSRGRTFRDKIFQAAYDATAKGIDPSSDVEVQTLLASYLQYRQGITQAIANDLKQGTNTTSDLEKYMIFAFGVVFVATILALVFAFPNPTPFQYTIVRIILALSTAAVATLLTGFLTVEVSNYIKAGGALAVFVIVYFWSPAALVAEKK
jgi:hypothetical protein